MVTSCLQDQYINSTKPLTLNEGEAHGSRMDIGSHKCWQVWALQLVSEPKPDEDVESSGLTPSPSGVIVPSRVYGSILGRKGL